MVWPKRVYRLEQTIKKKKIKKGNRDVMTDGYVRSNQDRDHKFSDTKSWCLHPASLGSGCPLTRQ